MTAERLDPSELEAGTRSLRDFVVAGWHVAEPRQRAWGWHLDAICEYVQAAIERDLKRLLITIPPRCTKSLSVSVFAPAWAWLIEPTLKMLYTSYAQPRATADSTRCRWLIESPLYAQFRSYVQATRPAVPEWRLMDDENLKTRYSTTVGGVRIATSVGGGSTGEGGDLLVCDDPHKLEDSDYPNRIEEAVEWWKGTMQSRLNDPENGAMIVVQQRVHEADLAGWCIEEGYEHLCLPMRYDPKHAYITVPRTLPSGRRLPGDPRTEPGELLQPERFTPERVAELERTLASKASGQLQQDPTPAEGIIFSAGRFGRFDLEQAREIAAHATFVCTSWDMTFKDLDTSDFVVGQVWAADGSRRYLLDEARGQWEFTETIQQLLQLREKWPETLAHYVEDTANGPAVISALKRAVPGLIPVQAKGSKVSRARAAAVFVEAGDVYLPEGELGNDVLAELRKFPKGTYDDRVDAFAHAMRKLATHGKPVELGPKVL